MVVRFLPHFCHSHSGLIKVTNAVSILALDTLRAEGRLIIMDLVKKNLYRFYHPTVEQQNFVNQQLAAKGLKAPLPAFGCNCMRVSQDLLAPCTWI